MMMRASSSLRCVCVLGLAASILAFGAKLPQPIDPLSAVGLAFSLWIAGLAFVAIGLAALGLLRLITGVVLALAPLALWISSLLCDPLGVRQRQTDRRRMDRLFPPNLSLRGYHVS